MSFDAVTALLIGASDVRAHYSCRDTILYTLGLGMGGDPLDPDQIAFVYEGQGSPRVMPTLPVVPVPSNTQDRNRVVYGQSVSVRVAVGERRIYKQNNNEPCPIKATH